MKANNMRTILRRRCAAALATLCLVALPVMAEAPATHDLTPQFVTAGAVVDGLRAVEVGGIVVLRGRTSDRASAEQAAAIAQSLGYARVANLIQIAGAPDDARIARIAERKLAGYRGMDGTQIAVESSNGVVRLSGKVANEMQKDMAVQLVRNIDGVRAVQIALQR
jgi:hyperosmotically inducible periplasmic protein